MNFFSEKKFLFKQMIFKKPLSLLKRGSTIYQKIYLDKIKVNRYTQMFEFDKTKKFRFYFEKLVLLVMLSLFEHIYLN